MKGMAELLVKSSKKKVPIGTLLVADELIVPQDLEFALEHQRTSKQLLGEILISIGALKRSDLESMLGIQSGALAFSLQ
jgi:hypothetical protein